MFGRCNVHFEALAQRLLAAPGSMFMHVPQIVRICGGACVPSRRYLSRCVSSRVLNVYDVAAVCLRTCVSTWRCCLDRPSPWIPSQFHGWMIPGRSGDEAFEINRTVASFGITGFTAVRFRIQNLTRSRRHTGNTTPRVHGSVVTRFVLAAKRVLENSPKSSMMERLRALRSFILKNEAVREETPQNGS